MQRMTILPCIDSATTASAAVGKKSGKQRQPAAEEGKGKGGAKREIRKENDSGSGSGEGRVGASRLTR